jgi:hypothetical protein
MKDSLITGSVAMYHWFPDSRVPKDIDVITRADLKSSNPIECSVDSQWNRIAPTILAINVNHTFVDPNILYTIKVSHAHWDVKWKKTMLDIEFLGSKGCVLNRALYSELFSVWEEIHGKKKVNLNMGLDSFFNKHVKRKYVHDDLHKLVAFYEEPLYTRFAKNENTAMSCEIKWNALSYSDQCKAALEEIIVIAIERYNLTLESSFVDALKAINGAYFKLVTSMTTGWFALFLILNHLELLKENKETCLRQLTKSLLNLSQLRTLY